MTPNILDSKLLQVLTQQDDDEIYTTCLEYLYQLPSQERLKFVLENNFEDYLKPKNMKKSLIVKVVNELGFNPFLTDFWSFVELDNFVEKQFTSHEDINLDSFNSTNPQILLNEVIKKLTTPNKDYSIEFEYEVRDHEYFMSHIFIGPDNDFHTLVYYDEQNGVEVDRFSIEDIIECYLETK